MLELADLAARGVKNLVLTHITEQFDEPGARERVIGEIARHLQGQPVLGEDTSRWVMPPALDKLM